MTNDGEYIYSLDANNMIKDVDGGSTAVYKYDVSGQRIMKTIGSETIYYVFGVGQYSSVSGWDKVYVHLGRKKLLEYSGGMTYFFGTDHLATPRVQTDVSATVTETWSSYPYGEEWQQSGPGTEENRFTGHLLDSETDQHYAGARFLDQKSRWLSVDAVQGNSSNPQHLNRFSYTLSDPVNHVDPDGRFTCGLGLRFSEESELCEYSEEEGFVGGRPESSEAAQTQDDADGGSTKFDPFVIIQSTAFNYLHQRLAPVFRERISQDCTNQFNDFINFARFDPTILNQTDRYGSSTSANQSILDLAQLLIPNVKINSGLLGDSLNYLGDSGGFTFFNLILMKSSEFSVDLLFHELYHVGQFFKNANLLGNLTALVKLVRI